jgi:hypothetical protein
MAYNKEDLIKKSLAAIKKHKLIFIEEVASYLPCNRATFYNHNLDKLDTIEEALETNKINTKAKLRKKWETGDNAALNLALYRLCSTPEEKEKIAPTTNHNVNAKVEGVFALEVNQTKDPLPTDDQLED